MHNLEGECIVYTQTIVPSSMRSTYWKYFGFPGNDNHEILTKNRVVCTICNKVISYNKNTSNLRTHLVAKHPEKLFGLNNALSQDGGGNETIQPSVVLPKIGKPKKSAIRKEEPSEMSFEVLEENNYICYIPGNEPKITEDHKTKNICKKEEPTESSYKVVGEEVERTTIEATTEAEVCNIKPVSCSNQILDVVIKDLVEPSCFSGPEFISFLNRNGLEFDDERLESALKEEYEIASGIEVFPTGQFSLGVEVFTNSHGSKFLSVFTTILKDTLLETNILSIINFEVEGETSLDELLTKLDLDNCSAVVLSSDYPEEQLEAYFSRHNIPVIWCLHSVLKRIVAKVFQLEEVSFINLF